METRPLGLTPKSQNPGQPGRDTGAETDILPKISVVIATKGDSADLRACLAHTLALDYPDYDILVLPDYPIEDMPAGVKVIPTGPQLPAAKRDMALAFATGEIVAFLDDDAFPRQDWLQNAAPHFSNPAVAAVAGPAVTPPDDSQMAQASGIVYASPLGGGSLTYRYRPQAAREVDDYPTCNLLVRKSILATLGGFNTRFWPGEDTKLCLEITKVLGKKILYVPEVLVYHRRRALFGPHLHQVKSYSLHRGYFVKRYPSTSLRLSYFLPTALVLGILLGPLFALIHPIFQVLYLGAIGAYLAAALLTGIIWGRARLFLPVTLGVILTHLTYGLWFLKGLLSSQLKEEAQEPALGRSQPGPGKPS